MQHRLELRCRPSWTVDIRPVPLGDWQAGLVWTAYAVQLLVCECRCNVWLMPTGSDFGLPCFRDIATAWSSAAEAYLCFFAARGHGFLHVLPT